MKSVYKTVKIIVADDHEIFRDGFKSLVSNQKGIELVAEAPDGKQLVSLTGKYLPDVVLTDIKMPVMDGIDATRIISEKYPEVGIIALSMFNDSHLIVDMLVAGAKGFLLKNAHKKDILDAIETVNKNNSYYCNSTSRKLARLIVNSQFDPAHKTKTFSFTRREKEVMELICQELSNREISTKLELSVRTIEGHRERILEKTKSRNTAGIVVYAMMHGIYKPE